MVSCGFVFIKNHLTSGHHEHVDVVYTPQPAPYYPPQPVVAPVYPPPMVAPVVAPPATVVIEEGHHHVTRL